MDMNRLVSLVSIEEETPAPDKENRWHLFTSRTVSLSVAVGTALASGPPHGSVREGLPHTALTAGLCDGQPLFAACRTHHNLCDSLPPALCPARVRLWCVPLGRPLSLCGLRGQRFRAGFVRPLHWYYEAVRLPTDVHVDITAFSLLRPSHPTIPCGRLQGLPVLAHGASPHA